MSLKEQSIVYTSDFSNRITANVSVIILLPWLLTVISNAKWSAIWSE